MLSKIALLSIALLLFYEKQDFLLFYEVASSSSGSNMEKMKRYLKDLINQQNPSTRGKNSSSYHLHIIIYNAALLMCF